MPARVLVVAPRLVCVCPVSLDAVSIFVFLSACRYPILLLYRLVVAVLSDPLMSLVDTASIGQISSLHVGALGPCSSLFMLIFVVTSFLSVAVTNIVASSATNGAMMPAVKELRRERYEADIIIQCVGRGHHI